MQIRKAFSPAEKATAPASASASASAPTEGENEEDADNRVLNEMEELKYAMDQRKKREKKLIAKKRAKVGCLVSLSPFFLYAHTELNLHIFGILEDVKFDQYIW